MVSRRLVKVSWSFALSLAVLALLNSCGPRPITSEDEARLSLTAEPNITIHPGESIDLSWLLVRQKSGPQAGEMLNFSIISAATEHDCMLSTETVATDGAGMGSTTFTAGPWPLIKSIQVQGAVTSIAAIESIPAPRSYTISIVEQLRVLRPEPADADRHEGLTEGRLNLAVRASTDNAHPLPQETIDWKITSGSGGGAEIVHAQSITDVRGVAWTELMCGSQPTTITVQASMAGTEPVVFTVQILEWGSCDDANPCPRGWSCVDGSCVANTPACTDDDECEEGQRCRFGECVTAAGAGDTCKLNEDCPEGYICVGDDCICDAEECGCDDHDDPDLSGNWRVISTYHLREALPSWLDDLLETLGPICRFLSDGILDGFDFDIPIIGGTLEDAADSLVESYIPSWVGELARAIADIDELISTLRVAQEMDLRTTGSEDHYTGAFEWLEVNMSYRGEEVRGDIEDITGMEVEADTFSGESICGTFYIHEHDVEIAVGSIVRWVLDVLVTAVSGGEYYSLEEFLESLEYYCSDLAMAIEDLAWDLTEGLDISLPDIYSIVEGACVAGVEAGAKMIVDMLDDIMVSSDALVLSGSATIETEDKMVDGVWDGELYDRDFPGEFTASR